MALAGDGGLWATYVAPSSSASVDLIFDVTGYFTPDSLGATYHTLTPARILDSRSGLPFGASRSPREFAVAGHAGVDLGAIAVTGNLTVTGQTRAGYVGLTTTTTAPSGIPATSTLNFPLADNRANGVTIALASNGGLWATYVGAGASTTATANLIFDVTGYFSP